MKILLLGINYRPEPTGIGKYTSEMGEYLSGQGHKVSAITGFPYYPEWKLQQEYRNWWWQHEKIKGVRVTRCPLYVPGTPSGSKRMLQDFSFMITSGLAITAHLLTQRRYDMVFVASPSMLSGLVGVWYKWWSRRTRLVYHVQDLQVDAAAELGMIKRGWLLRIMQATEDFVLKSSTHVSTISTGMQQKLMDKPAHLLKVELLPNWTDENSIFKTTPDAGLLTKLGLPEGKKIFLYSGAMGEKQGLELVIQAAHSIRNRYPEAVFVISGNGPYKATLEALAKAADLQNLYFIDLQALPVFNQLLNEAWCHLVVQKEQAADLLLPSKLTNILAVGGLCIVTASPGTTLYETVHGGHLGIICQPNSADALAQSFEKALAQPSNSPYRQNAWAYAQRHLQMGAIIDRFMGGLKPSSRTTFLPFAPLGNPPGGG